MHPRPENAIPELIAASTAGMRERDKFDYWHGVVCKAVVDLDPQPVGRARFDASLNSIVMNNMAVSRIAPPRIGSRAFPPRFPDRVQKPWSSTSWSGGRPWSSRMRRSVHLRVGDGAVCDAQRPYELRFDEDIDIASIRMPRALFVHSAS